MKTFLTILISTGMLLLLTSCNTCKNSSETISTNTIAETENPTAAGQTEEKIFTDITDASYTSTATILIDTEYYTLSVPSYWNNNCFYEITEGESYSYTISFYEKASHDTINGGWLFSINLLTEFKDYSRYPDYEILGSLVVYRIGSYNIVVTYPTDVQFTEKTFDNYNKLKKDIPNILKTIAFKDECSYSEEPIAITETLGEDILTETQYKSRANGIWHHTISITDTTTLMIYEGGVFELHYISMGEVKETTKGIYTIIFDDGQYQEFKFVNSQRPQETWTAKIWQTELKDSSGVVYNGIVYINSENETIYYTGRTW